MPEDKEKIEKAHCNRCGHDTKHLVLAVRRQGGSEPVGRGFEISWSDTYYLLECCGCESISVKRVHWFSEDPMDEHVEYYPPRVARREPSWLEQLPEEAPELMREIYGALHADHRRLALMGVRAVIDGLLLRQVDDVGGFADKLKALEEKGFLSQVNRDVLEAALEAGHAAVHRGYRPSSEDLNRVMDIVENVLQAEILGPAAEKLRKATPAREKGKKTSA